MKKQYFRPTATVVDIHIEQSLLAGSMGSNALPDMQFSDDQLPPDITLPGLPDIIYGD